jgi:hypothetical protein
VFRDHFRINPYGGQDDDWLELDKKALGAKGYKVNRSQIIGQVLLSSRNFALVEQTNREGLAENPSKQVLVGMLRHILITEFRRFIERVDREKKVTDETTTDDLDKLIEQASSKVELKLLELRRIAPEHSADLEELQRLVVGLGRLVDQAKVMAQEYEDDRSKFVHLAGIGLMVEFILHEIGRATHSALRVMEEIDSSRLDRAEAASLRVLSGQLSTLIKRVDTLDPLSTSRRQTKEVFDLTELVEQVIDSRSQQLARHGVTLVLDRPSGPPDHRESVRERRLLAQDRTASRAGVRADDLHPPGSRRQGDALLRQRAGRGGGARCGNLRTLRDLQAAGAGAGFGSLYFPRDGAIPRLGVVALNGAA